MTAGCPDRSATRRDGGAPTPAETSVPRCPRPDDPPRPGATQPGMQRKALNLGNHPIPSPDFEDLTGSSATASRRHRVVPSGSGFDDVKPLENAHSARGQRDRRRTRFAPSGATAVPPRPDPLPSRNQATPILVAGVRTFEALAVESENPGAPSNQPNARQPLRVERRLRQETKRSPVSRSVDREVSLVEREDRLDAVTFGKVDERSVRDLWLAVTVALDEIGEPLRESRT